MKHLFALLLALLLTAAHAQEADRVAPDDQEPVTITTEIFLVSQVTRDDGTREERFTPITEARPGQVVEYRITVQNVTSDEVLPGGIVVITAPVPEGTAFVANSATPSSDAILTEYSADFGATRYEENVFVTRADGAKAIADPSEYTTITWTVRSDLEPGATVVLVYRVTIR